MSAAAASSAAASTETPLAAFWMSAAASSSSGPAAPPAAFWMSAAAASRSPPNDFLRSRTSSPRSSWARSFSVDWRRSVMRRSRARASFASDSAFTSSGVFWRNEARRIGTPSGVFWIVATLRSLEVSRRRSTSSDAAGVGVRVVPAAGLLGALAHLLLVLARERQLHRRGAAERLALRVGARLLHLQVGLHLLGRLLPIRASATAPMEASWARRRPRPPSVGRGVLADSAAGRLLDECRRRVERPTPCARAPPRPRSLAIASFRSTGGGASCAARRARRLRLRLGLHLLGRLLAKRGEARRRPAREASRSSGSR